MVSSIPEQKLAVLHLRGQTQQKAAAQNFSRESNHIVYPGQHGVQGKKAEGCPPERVVYRAMGL